MLSKEEVITGLKRHNKWRRGDDSEMMNPTEIGEIIDTAIALLESNRYNSNYAKCADEICKYLDLSVNILDQKEAVFNILKKYFT